MRLIIISILLSSLLVSATNYNDGARFTTVEGFQNCTISYTQYGVSKLCLEHDEPEDCLEVAYGALETIAKEDHVPVCEYLAGVLTFTLL